MGRWQGPTRGDVVAGLTVALVLVPQSIAYAVLAGVPAVHGLYAAAAAPIVAGLVGSSPYLQTGPVAIDSLLTAAAVAPLADGDPERYLALASVVALVVGVLQATAGVVGLGGLVNFLSVPVITGFTTAAALTIAVTQLKDLLGLDGVDPATTFVEAVRAAWPHLDTTSAAVSYTHLTLPTSDLV